MSKIAVQLTIEELQELLELVDNQLFRMKFIDPKIPGFKNNPEKLQAANSAVQTLREAFRKGKGFKTKDDGGWTALKQPAAAK